MNNSTAFQQKSPRHPLCAILYNTIRVIRKIKESNWRKPGEHLLPKPNDSRYALRTDPSIVTTTALPIHEVIHEDSRRIVRSHAIRDADRRKRLGPTTGGEVRPRNLVPAPQSTFITKFRLEPIKSCPRVISESESGR